MFNKLYILLLLLSLPVVLHCTPLTQSIKEIHNNLFTLFLPHDHTFSDAQCELLTMYQKKCWKHVKHSPLFQSLLQPLTFGGMNFPDDIKNQFADICTVGFTHVTAQRQEQFLLALRRHEACTLRSYATAVRKFYIFMAYSNPLTNELSGVSCNSEFQPNEINLNLAPSNLRVVNNTIIHNDGPIDYLIIGTGPAGCLIAHELARLKKDCRIVIIEAGSFVKPQTIITESASELMESSNQRTNTTGGIIIRNGCTVGGGTTVNLDLAFSPLMPSITQNLQNWIDNQWIDKTLFHQKHPHDWQHLQEIYTWIQEKVKTRLVASDEINNNNKILQQAAFDTVHTYSLNQKERTGTPNEILKISAVDAFLLPALQGGNEFLSTVNLIPDAKITRIIFNEEPCKIASAVEIIIQNPLDKDYIEKDPNNFGLPEGTKITIPATTIILSAGTLGSAEILLRSNLENEQIGKGIVIHPSIGVFARFDKEINVMEGLSASVFAHAKNLHDSYFFEAMAAEPRFVATIHPGSGTQILDAVKNFKQLGGFGIMLVDSVSEHNKVYINPKTNTVEIDYQLIESDKIRLRKALKTATEMLFDQGAQEVFLPTSEPILSQELIFFPITNRADIDKAIDAWNGSENQNFISSAHMQGSVKMGNHPSNSVVSHNFRVWNTKTNNEIPNLYVMDSSIFPTSVGANPMQSIYTIAKLFVDQLINSNN